MVVSFERSHTQGLTQVIVPFPNPLRLGRLVDIDIGFRFYALVAITGNISTED